MGWFNLLKNANNIEGTRESIRISFDNLFRKTPVAESTRTAQVAVSLLAQRWSALGRPSSFPVVTVEALPFYCMRPAECREALAEYIGSIQHADDSRKDWLGAQVTVVIRSVLFNPTTEVERDAQELLIGPAAQLLPGCVWFYLLPDDLQERLLPDCTST